MRKADKVMSADRKMRSQIRGLLRLGLQQGTEVQLYNRTPLEVSRRMFRSIFTKSTRSSVAVGYKASVAPHVKIRLDKKGRSKTGGHDMTMKPAEFIQRVYGARLSKVGENALHSVTETQ
jgi:hypothetical protein